MSSHINYDSQKSPDLPCTSLKEKYKKQQLNVYFILIKYFNITIILCYPKLNDNYGNSITIIIVLTIRFSRKNE